MVALPGPLQLDLPLAPGAAMAWTVVIPGPARLSFAVRLLDSGVSAELLGRWPGADGWSDVEEQWRLELLVRPPARLRTRVLHRPKRLLEPPGLGGELDPLLQAVLDRAERMHPTSPEALARLRWSVALIEEHVRRLVDPEASRLAVRFSPKMRWPAYEMATNDPTGRVRQAGAICPGLLTFTRAIAERDPARAASVLAAVVRGARLRRVLDEAVGAWAALGGAGDPRHQRLRIARAGPLVPSTTLWMVPPGAPVPEDIPVEPSANAAWFEIQHVTSGALNHVALDRRIEILAFTSRHAVELMPQERRGELAHRLQDAADYLRATGRHVARTTAPARLFQQSREWHEQEPYLRDLAPRETPLPAGRGAGLELWSLGGFHFRFLDTVGAVADESARMHHCVVMYSGDAAAGHLHVYHGERRGQHFTMAISWTDNGPRLIEASGVANRRLTDVEQRAITAWLGDLGEAARARHEHREPTLRGAFLAAPLSATPAPTVSSMTGGHR